MIVMMITLLLLMSFFLTDARREDYQKLTALAPILPKINAVFCIFKLTRFNQKLITLKDFSSKHTVQRWNAGLEKEGRRCRWPGRRGRRTWTTGKNS